MKDLNIDTFIITLTTEHLEEYPCEIDHILKKIIGFSGSNGTLILNKSLENIRYIFITDSRYEIVGKEIIKEMKKENINLELKIIKSYSSYFEIFNELNCKRIGVNLKKLDILFFKQLIEKKEIKYIETLEIKETEKIEPKDIFKLFNQLNNNKELDNNIVLIDLDIFKTIPRPIQTPFSLEVELDLKSEKYFNWKNLNFSIKETKNNLICGETYFDKFSKLFKGNLKNKIIIFSALHEINYLLNIRTKDSNDSPHLFCFMIASYNKIQLYCNSNFSNSFFKDNNELTIEIKKYEEFYFDVKKLINVSNNENILLSSPNSYLLNLFNKNKEIIDFNKIIKNKLTEEIKKMMDKKNLNELRGFIECGIIHGVSLIKLFVKLEKLSKIKAEISEEGVANLLNNIFKEHPDFLMNSFNSIVGTGKNGASIHHMTSTDLIKWDELLLLDCGLQTKYGTTDISRTVIFSKEVDKYINDYTLVLRAQLNGKMIIGTNTSMKYLTQYVSRYFINQEYKDYKHSTGHGVGFCGCVHENTDFIEGSVFSVEPGLYIEGYYGIRLEDVVTAQLKKGQDEFLSLTPLTYVPYQMNLINTSKLTKYEIKYLNEYNELIRTILSPFLNEEELNYLEKNTKKL